MGGTRDGQYPGWAGGMGAGRYAGRAVRGTGGRYAPGFARSFNLLLGGTGLRTAPVEQEQQQGGKFWPFGSQRPLLPLPLTLIKTGLNYYYSDLI